MERGSVSKSGGKAERTAAMAAAAVGRSEEVEGKLRPEVEGSEEKEEEGDARQVGELSAALESLQLAGVAGGVQAGETYNGHGDLWQRKYL
jgi:hypothetical protein